MVNVGILHSLSGTMAISETSLKDIALLAIEEINQQGGLLGKQLRPIVIDPASSWPLFEKGAQALLTEGGAVVTFGCWTSLARKSVIPLFEKHNGLLFYPVQYEGQEASRNVFYTGATPNQQALVAVDYLRHKEAGGVEHWVLLGTDYLYPRTTNKILRAYLRSLRVSDANISEEYTAFGETDYVEQVARLREKSKRAKTAVISTINGDSNVAFYEELAEQNITADLVPVMALSVGEEELRQVDTKNLVGHLATWNYFMSIDTQQNLHFIDKWRAYVAQHNLPDRGRRVTNDPMVATYVGIQLWKQAVLQAEAFDVGAVRQALAGQKVMGPDGIELEMSQENHHLSRPAYVGAMRTDGQFQIVYRSPSAIKPEPFSPYLERPARQVANWRFPWVCSGCESPRYSARQGFDD